MAHDGPPLFRPVPRRPLNLENMSATPPEDDDQPSVQFGSSLRQRQPDLLASRFLDVGSMPAEVAASLSRSPSIRNLTSSTLMGIYSQAASNRDRALGYCDDQANIPWGTGAQTPIRSNVDMTHSLLGDRVRIAQRLSFLELVGAARAPSNTVTVVSVTLRATLLFMLGIGYGILVTRLHSENQYLADLSDGVIAPRASWGYLAFWGVSGLVMGSLLPWLDKVWEGEDAAGTESAAAPVVVEADVRETLTGTGTDWALVMRAIGAFVGIVFAIVSLTTLPFTLKKQVPFSDWTDHLFTIQRKLAWASTLQVSWTLALVNPLLWWLIDRSKPGFLLSVGVGLVGSALLLGVKPRIVPAAAAMPWQSPDASNAAAMTQNATSSSLPRMQGVSPPVLGGFADWETFETGVWMLSVLFCSCVCFGNIGRLLVWSRNAGGKGRWGVVR